MNKELHTESKTDISKKATKENDMGTNQSSIVENKTKDSDCHSKSSMTINTFNYKINTLVKSNNMKGDVVGSDGTKYEANNGDVNIEGILRTDINNLHAELVKKPEIDFIKSVFVENPNYQDIKKSIRNNSIIIAYGEKEIGKYSTILNALVELGYHKIHKIQNMGIDNKKILEYPYKENDLYIFDKVFTPDNNFDITFIQNLEKEIYSKNAKVIIIFDKNLYHSLNEHFGKYSFYIEKTNDLVKIMSNHFNYYIGEYYKNDQAQTLNFKTSFKDIINDISKDIETITPMTARKASNIITNGFINSQENITIIETVKNFLNGVHEKYEKLENIQEKLFCIVLCCFNDSKYSIVQTAYERLIIYLEKVLSKNDRKNLLENNYINTPRKQRLEKLHAKIIYKIEEESCYQSKNVEYLSLIYPEYSERIIEYIWEEYESWRIPLLRWLFDIALEQTDFRNINGLNKTLALIAKLDFNLIENYIGYLFSASDDEYSFYKYRACSKIFCLLCENDNLANKIFSLIHHWATESKNQHLIIIAIYTYFLLCKNIDNPHLIYEDILYITKTIKEEETSINLLISLVHCMSRLLEVEIKNSDNFESTIVFISENTNNNDFSSKFLKQVFMHTIYSSESYYGSKEYPSLLLGFKLKTSFRKSILQLFKTCIETKEFGDFPIEIIQDFIYSCKVNDNLYIMLETFLLHLIRDLSLIHRNKVINVLINSANKKEPWSLCAQSILNELKKYNLVH